MKKNYILFAFIALMGLVSCDKFLDTLPDNRTDIDSVDKLRAVLVSAYPQTDYMLLTEFMSDDVDDYSKTNPNYDRFIQQVFNWEDVTETDNEDPESIWRSSYRAIATANEALAAIEKMGGAEAAGLEAEKAEALLCRAYNHFILVNLFCKNYNSQTSDKDMGITYSMEPETDLRPEYDRGTVAQVYEKIEQDIEAGLSGVSDTYYRVPKYHFNRRAAYAFATRFFLYYEKWDKAEACANEVLGTQPTSMLRDWRDQAAMEQDEEVITEHYIDATLNCNLLLLTAYSKMGLAFRNYYVYARYAHGNYLANNEDGIALTSLWGGSNNGDNNGYWSPMKVYSGTNMDRVIFWKLPYLFEYTDPVARIGYYRTVYPAFTTDETLLNRAEAKIMLGEYDDAVKDMNLWIANIAKNPKVLTVESIVEYFNSFDYATWRNSTPKKHLNPAFSIGKEGDVRECMLQCVLGLRRIEALGVGLRWFDIKRYGIEIEHREMDERGVPARFLDKLTKEDPRRAIQIPRRVIDAGYEPNPR